MKIVHLNTSINRSSAPYKLHKAMKRVGIDSSILVMNGEDGPDVEIVKRSVLYRIKRHIYARKRKKSSENFVYQKYAYRHIANGYGYIKA